MAGVKSDNPGKPDNDPAIGAGFRCCQQAEILQQDAEVAKSYVSQIAQCILLYRNNETVAGNTCIDRIRTPPPGILLMPASYSVGKTMYNEALARQAMTTNSLQQSSCRKQ